MPHVSVTLDLRQGLLIEPPRLLQATEFGQDLSFFPIGGCQSPKVVIALLFECNTPVHIVECLLELTISGKVIAQGVVPSSQPRSGETLLQKRLLLMGRED